MTLPLVPTFPTYRPRRLRRTEALRRLVTDVVVRPSDLVLPMFVREDITEPVAISSMPGVVQHTQESLVKAAVEAVELGVGGLMIFGIPATKDAMGSGAVDPDGVLNVALRRLSSELGDSTVLMSDLCLDEFTDHGHCGVLAASGGTPGKEGVAAGEGSVDNDATLAQYVAVGLVQAESGAHLLGTSGMMDGQVGAVRAALDVAGFVDTGILGYAPKYASAFYGPFREAVNSSLVGDRKSYQQDAARSIDEALAEVALDVAEGADIVMVKPALPYLDVLAAVAQASPVPVAAYQISGEYAMVEAAAANGWLDRDRAIVETLTSIKRAGASIILTYWAVDFARGL
jgi:porphobilinogen synthase